MRNTKRAALWGVPLSLALLLAACSDDDSADDSTTTTTTTEASTASSSDTTAATEPPASETTAEPAASEPPATEPASQAGSPLPTDTEDWAGELVRAWGAGDRDRAAELATPQVVDELFGHADPAGDDWALLTCGTTVSTSVCTFTSASRAESLTTHQGPGSGPGGAPPAVDEAVITPTGDVTAEQEDAANALVRAWGAGDRERAAELATPQVVDQLFSRADPGGPGWDLTDCLTIDDRAQCVFDEPDQGERLIVHFSGGQWPIGSVELRDTPNA